jgi:hypothetical protein
MSAKITRFIVVMLGETDSFSYDHQLIQQLLKIVDSSEPAAQSASHMGVVAYYFSSPVGLAAVEALIPQVERLRDTDSRFASLSIGMAEGELLAEFDESGCLSTDSFTPLGGALNDAASNQRGPRKYVESLRAVRERVQKDAT